MSQKLPDTNKSLGQHWLSDDAALASIADAAEIVQTDTVVEIGPGPGSLTKLLVKRAGQVVAVEFDATLARALPKQVPATNLQVHTADIMRFDFTSVQAPYKVVANIPYYLTSNLIRVLSESPNPPTSVVLLIQKEVAERVCAQPGRMSILSVTAQYYWQVKLGISVKAELFTPPPKVDSQVIIMQRRTEPLFANLNPADYFAVIKAGFGQRRKTLLNSLSAGLRLDKQIVTAACTAAKIDPSRRAQTLSLLEWHALYIQFKTHSSS